MTPLEAAYAAHTPGSPAFLAAVDFAGRYQVSDTEEGRIAQLLMMVAFDRHVDRALQLTAQLFPLLVQAAGGVDEFRRFALYLMATQDLDVIQTLREALRHQGLEEGDEIMTYAEQLLAEGRAEGEARGRTETQVEVVEGLLRVGVTWDVIEAATGLSETGFEVLKTQLAGSDS